MRFVTEDGIADVVEVGRVGAIEEQRIFYLAGVAHHTVIADDNMLPNVGVVADLTIAADNRRALDHDAILHDGAFPDSNLLANVRDAFAPVVQTRAHARQDVSLDFSQGFPGALATLEDRSMLRLTQIEQLGSFEHPKSLA